VFKILYDLVANESSIADILEEVAVLKALDAVGV